MTIISPDRQPKPRFGHKIFSDYFDFSVAPTRGHLYKLYKYRCDSVRASFFASRVVNVWNSLPESVVFTSLSAFKLSIRTVDFNQFLKCNINQLNRATVSVVISLVVLLMYVMFYCILSWCFEEINKNKIKIKQSVHSVAVRVQGPRTEHVCRR